MRDGSRKRNAGARSGSRRPRIRGGGRPAAYGAAALLVAFGIVNCAGGGDAGAPAESSVRRAAAEAESSIGEAAQTLGFRSLGEARDAVARIMEASGLRADFEIEVVEGLDNVAAMMRSPCGNPRTCRVVAYDPRFLLDVERQTDQWGPVSIMAHEVARHLLGHTVFGLDSNTQYEADAEFLSGFILQRLGASLESAQAARRLLGSPRGSSLEMIATGWREARRVDGAPLFLEGEEGELTRDVPVAADPPPDD